MGRVDYSISVCHNGLLFLAVYTFPNRGANLLPHAHNLIPPVLPYPALLPHVAATWTSHRGVVCDRHRGTCR